MKTFMQLVPVFKKKSNPVEISLTERRGSKAVRLPDNCSRATAGGRVLSMLTVAIFTGSPGAISYSSVRAVRTTRNSKR